MKLGNMKLGNWLKRLIRKRQLGFDVRVEIAGRKPVPVALRLKPQKPLASLPWGYVYVFLIGPQGNFVKLDRAEVIPETMINGVSNRIIPLSKLPKQEKFWAEKYAQGWLRQHQRRLTKRSSGEKPA